MGRLIPIIDEYLVRRVSDERCTQCFHPSRISSSCMRLAYFDYFRETYAVVSNVEPRLLRIFDNGHAVHDRIQGYLENCGVLLEREVPVYDRELRICGHCDGLLDIGLDDLVVLEIKSIARNYFRNLFKAKQEHVYQAHIYMYTLGVPYAIILYECKDSQELREFFITYDESIANQTLNRIRVILYCVQSGVLPPREISRSCDFCDKKEVCSKV